jgi:carbonic anhydrase
MASELTRPQTPAEAFKAVMAGNQRFATGTQAHPRQGVDRIGEVADGQRPFATLFGCADSRLSAEIIFDVGLGDLFVVRNAGQVIAETILGSLEFSVEALEVPLILVLGHDNCGAIRATIDSVGGGSPTQGEFIASLVKKISPIVEAAHAEGVTEIDDITKMHVIATVDEILSRSKLIAEAVAEGRLAVVGANYRLNVGEVHPFVIHGNV